MKKIVYLYDYAVGYKTEIDNIDVPEEYTDVDYLKECDSNGVVWHEGTYNWDYRFILEVIECI